MSIYWNKRDDNFGKPWEHQARDEAWEWIYLCKELPYPINRYQLPRLPGIYCIVAELQPKHLKLQIIGRGGN